jgi:hypothetical protein
VIISIISERKFRVPPYWGSPHLSHQWVSGVGVGEEVGVGVGVLVAGVGVVSEGQAVKTIVSIRIMLSKAQKKFLCILASFQ